MLNNNEMCRFLHEAGFHEVRCFGEFTAREEVKTNSKRLIFVAVRGGDNGYSNEGGRHGRADTARG